MSSGLSGEPYDQIKLQEMLKNLVDIQTSLKKEQEELISHRKHCSELAMEKNNVLEQMRAYLRGEIIQPIKKEQVKEPPKKEIKKEPKKEPKKKPQKKAEKINN